MATAPSGFDLMAFRSAFKTGGTRQNLFAVDLTFPTWLTTAVGAGQLSFLCRSSQLPGQDLGVIEIGYFGRKIKVAGDRTFPEWTITILNDEDFKMRDAFTEWSNGVNQHEANVRIGAAKYLDDYQVSANVYQYAKTGEVIKKYEMVGAFPSNIAAIDLAWDTNDQIEEFNVTMQYSWWNLPASTSGTGFVGTT